ncbi:MAG: 1-acyl-sn-glycerol-3-phosphate acyltransferase [Spirochaetes bacterium]|nr:1-acyl-sn-glycerol-3-phosphate acyltransferase [Spirochaetota bacterium]MBU0957123.1 1-acyl-sn-glycerol-3-phosphate acyltransferase [Spirochaetota bacterium]
MKRLTHYLVTRIIRTILAILCRVDAAELAKLPRQGPYMIIVNHVNFLEVPLLYAWLQPRIVHSLVKEETWNNPFLAFLANTWHAIPLKRGTADFAAFGAAEQVFKDGGILIMAPEGTRTGNGVLKKAHGGAALLAWYNRVPVYPLAHTGGEHFYHNLRRLRRTTFRFIAGDPVMVSADPSQKLDSGLRRQLTDELMGRLAILLPEEQRGFYLEQAAKTPQLLEIINRTEHA